MHFLNAKASTVSYLVTPNSWAPGLPPAKSSLVIYYIQTMYTYPAVHWKLFCLCQCNLAV